MGVEFTQPWWLLALPVAAAALLLVRAPWWRASVSGGGRPLWREGRLLGARLAWIALLVLALAGLSFTRTLDRQALILVLDASSSTQTVRDQVEAAARLAGQSVRSGDRVGVVAAAAGAQVEEPPTEQPLFRRLEGALPDGATDLAAGLRLAAALLPDGFAGHLALVTDGRQTRGDALAAVRELAGRGITVDVLPIGGDRHDLRVEAVELPETARKDEVSSLTVQLWADQPVDARLRVYRDNALVLERDAHGGPGRFRVALGIPAGSEGLHRYRVEVAAGDPAADQEPANNSLGAIQRVEGPAHVLVLAGSDVDAGLLPAALRASGAEVSVRAPAAAPTDLAGWAAFDAVVLSNVPASALPPGAMDLLEHYVQDLGRGLAMTGGPDSYGLGGYEGSPVERALPVYMDLRGRGKLPKVALALVIDKSGSMAGEKQEMAKEAAARSVDLLRPSDQAAVLAFDSVPQWVAPLTPMSEKAKVLEAIGGIYASGGTEIYPAAAIALNALRDVEADVKHIILMTDGQSGSGGDYGQLTAEMRQAGITLSAVAVGADADAGLLQAMARAGRGRYYLATDPASIPRIFTDETLTLTRTMTVNASFFPAVASPSPLLRGIEAAPLLHGYVATTPKERAEVVLVSPEGDPVLAAWQYGAGRAVAWTSDTGARWSGAWAGQPAAAALWGNVLSWLLPTPESGSLSVRMEPAGEAAAIVAEDRGGWDEVRPAWASVVGPDGARHDVELRPAGPGRYRGMIPTAEPGAYVVQARQATAGGAELRAEAGWAAPYPAEYRETGVDRAYLERLAEAGGGQVVHDASALAAPPARAVTSPWSAAPLLLVLAALLWPLEIAARRLAPPTLRLNFAPVRRRVSAAESSGDGGSAAVSTRSGAAAAPTMRRLLDRKRATAERWERP